MKTGSTEIGAARSFLSNCVAKSFELAAAYIIKIRAIRTRGSGFIEIDRNAEPTPDFESRLACEHDTLLELDRCDGNKRDNVGSSDARMQALLTGEVNQFNRLADTAQSRLDNGGWITRNRDDRAVVIRIH
jgi:hypothetical protein